MSASNEATLQEAVFQLITHHQNINLLLKEVDWNLEDSISEDGSEDCVISLMREQALSTKTSLKHLAASECANKLKTLFNSQASQVLLDQSHKRQVYFLVKIIKKLQEESSFATNSFIKLLNKEFILPIELIWILHKEDIMHLESYITCNLNRPSVIGKLAQNVATLCEKSDEDTQTARRNIVGDLVAYLVYHGHRDLNTEHSGAKGLKKVACALLDSITKKLITMEADRDVNLFEVVISMEAELEQTSLKKYSQRQLAVILGHNPILKVSEALQEQKDWSFARADSYITAVFTQLLTLFRAEETVQILRQVLEKQEVNWRAVLSFTATLLVCFRDAPKLLKDMITDLIHKALENSELDSIITGFLLARQGSLEGPHVFPSYSDWFQTMFGDPIKSPANTKKSFIFLMKFLSDIVPFETPQYLKAHILRPPFVPTKCRPALSDYITLAKTRLMDLKEPIEDLGIYESSSAAEKEKASHQAEQDVQKAIEVFAKTRKVPAGVMEASIFRKPYFVGRFLPTLLTPRPLPDTPDTRMNLIEALSRIALPMKYMARVMEHRCSLEPLHAPDVSMTCHANAVHGSLRSNMTFKHLMIKYLSEKIPTSLYASYQKSCKKIATQLLEGVFSDEEDLDDLLLSPHEQLKHSLDTLQQLVVQKSTTKDKPVFSAQISNISEKIHVFLGSEPTDSPSIKSAIEVQLSCQSIDKNVLKVVDGILNCVCQALVAVCNEIEPCRVWLSQLLVMITQHPSIHNAFWVRFLQLLAKGSELSSYHVRCLAALLVHALSLGVLDGGAVCRCGQIRKPILYHVIRQLKCTTKTSQIACYRFCTYYLDYAFSAFPVASLYHTETEVAVVPKEIIKLFCFLARRLSRRFTRSGTDIESDVSSLSDIIYKSTQFIQLTEDNKLTLEDWAKFEICISSEDDSFNPMERQDYIDSVVTQDYLVEPVDNGGCGGCVIRCCLCLGHVVMETYRKERTREASICNCKYFQETQKTGFMDIIHLIQRLALQPVHVSCPDRQCEHAKAWFVQLIPEAVESSHHEHTESCILDIFRLYKCLPAYLLLTDSVTCWPAVRRMRDLENAATVINKYFKNYLTNGFCLTFTVTCHLLQGLLQLPDNGNEELNFFLKKCPLLPASLAFHWPKICHLVVLSSGESAALSPLVELLKISSQPHSSLQNKQAIFKLGIGPTFRFRLDQEISLMLKDQVVGVMKDPLAQMLIGIGQARRILQNEADLTKSHFEDMIKAWCTDCSREQQSLPVIAFQECILAHLTNTFLYTNTMNQEVFHWVLTLWGLGIHHLESILDRRIEDNHLTHILPNYAQRMKPITCMRILTRSTESELQLLMFQDNFIRILLQLHVKSVQLYESGQTSSDETCQSVCFGQPLNVSLLTEFTALIKQVLRKTPKPRLRNLDTDLIGQCDSDLRQFLRNVI